MSATLSKELRSKHKVRSLPVRKDDEVSILKGAFILLNLKKKILKIIKIKNNNVFRYL